MTKKLIVLVKVIGNVVEKYPETKGFIENNSKEVYKGESMTVEEAIYFVGLVYRVER